MATEPTPTDAELAAMRAEFGITSNGRGIKEFTQVRDFARAILARWGVLRADKIVIPTDTMEQEFQKHYRRGYEAGLRAQPAPDDSVTEAAALLQEARDALWQPANAALCERIDTYVAAARKQGANHD